MSIQDTQDMPVAGLSGFARTPLKEQIKKYSDDTPHNGRQADQYGSRLCHKTGQVDARSSKAQSITDKNLNPSPEYLNGYDAIVWNSDKKE